MYHQQLAGDYPTLLGSRATETILQDLFNHTLDVCDQNRNRNKFTSEIDISENSCLEKYRIDVRIRRGSGSGCAQAQARAMKQQNQGLDQEQKQKKRLGNAFILQ